ncbi:hypothetical protein [Caldimonas sp. KR1-144]|uniref:hypothetical protein n=1 Tax=Caldimonas sp. KR1-144 TaxID=3400911 RepID=UPI003BFBB0E6
MSGSMGTLPNQEAATPWASCGTAINGRAAKSPLLRLGPVDAKGTLADPEEAEAVEEDACEAEIPSEDRASKSEADADQHQPSNDVTHVPSRVLVLGEPILLPIQMSGNSLWRCNLVADAQECTALILRPDK